MFGPSTVSWSQPRACSETTNGSPIALSRPGGRSSDQPVSSPRRSFDLNEPLMIGPGSMSGTTPGSPLSLSRSWSWGRPGSVPSKMPRPVAAPTPEASAPPVSRARRLSTRPRVPGACGESWQVHRRMRWDRGVNLPRLALLVLLVSACAGLGVSVVTVSGREGEPVQPLALASPVTGRAGRGPPRVGPAAGLGLGGGGCRGAAVALRREVDGGAAGCCAPVEVAGPRPAGTPSGHPGAARAGARGAPGRRTARGDRPGRARGPDERAATSRRCPEHVADPDAPG